MDGEHEAAREKQPEIVIPETFFPSEPLNQAFRQFLFHYCRLIDSVKVTLDRGRPQLEINISSAAVKRRVTLTFHSGAEGVIVKAATDISERNCPGVMQLILMFMNDHDAPRYRVEWTNNLIAQFYAEVPTDQLHASSNFYDLIIRLAEVASHLEMMEA